jgi:hypothetical protein
MWSMMKPRYAAWSRVRHFCDFPDAFRTSHFLPYLGTIIGIIGIVFITKYTPLGYYMPELVCTTC